MTSSSRSSCGSAASKASRSGLKVSPNSIAKANSSSASAFSALLMWRSSDVMSYDPKSWRGRRPIRSARQPSQVGSSARSDGPQPAQGRKACPARSARQRLDGLLGDLLGALHEDVLGERHGVLALSQDVAVL